jgi:signal peptidase I
MFQRQQQQQQQQPSPQLPPSPTPPPSPWHLYGTLLQRVAAAMGFVYVVTEYVADITLCEGPSMAPTIKPAGEIVLMDKARRRLLRGGGGFAGGATGSERVREARRRQASFERQQQQTSGEAKSAHGVAAWHEPRIPVTDLWREDGKRFGWWEAVRHVRSPIDVGDVVVVQHPARQGTVCKRVLGLPGDQVLLRRPLPADVLLFFPGLSSGGRRQIVTVPDGHVWVEGDNPANSSDSRHYGPVPMALVVGRVLARVWPLRGRAWMRRGARPQHQQRRDGSTVLPAGYEGQRIIKHVEQDNNGTKS